MTVTTAIWQAGVGYFSAQPGPPGIWSPASCKAAWAVISGVVKIAVAGVTSVIKVAWDLIVGIFNVALDLVTGHWGKAWADMRTPSPR